MGEMLGKLLVGAGAIIVLAGVVLLLLGRLTRLGHLPGDIQIARPGLSLRFPIVTSLVVSVVLTVLLNIVFRIWRR